MTRLVVCGAVAGLIVLPAACEQASGNVSVTRERLPDGTSVLRYTALPSPTDTLAPDLRIGTTEGSEAEEFGDIRGIEAADDGSIYILDAQALEVRAFGPDGVHISTLTRAGSGPSELSAANGMLLGPDGTLWVQDYRQRTLLGLSSTGEEVGREPMLTTGYGYLWNASIDRDGRFWQSRSYSDQPTNTAPEPGVQAGSSRLYYKSYDPATGAYDSVFVGNAEYRSFVVTQENGWTVFGVPFWPSALSFVDAAGNLWSARGDEYRIARRDAATGDTTLIVEVADQGPLVTDADRADRIATLDRYPDLPASLRAEYEAEIPERKPVLDQLVVDDAGRLWVGRTVALDAAPRYDVFDPDGAYLGSVTMPAEMRAYFAPVIRRDQVYMLGTNELDVPFVMRAAVPDFAR